MSGEEGGRRPPLPPGPYLVVGLARSGAAAARMLRRHGAVIGCDAGRPAEAEELAAEGFELHLESRGLELLERARTVVKSPGVPREAPVVAAARERGVEVAGELELAWRSIPNRFVAVTGTNGKTTTVELLGAILRAARREVAVAGNVGTALSSLAGELPADAIVACEVSSFQLEDASAFAPECAVLLNLTDDHLDRHGSFADYRAAKLRIFARQRSGDVAVAPVGLDLGEPSAPGVEGRGAARLVRFGGESSELALHGDRLCWEGEPLMRVGEVRLRGAHNLENAMAAAAAALSSGIGAEAVREVLATFRGVSHRLEEVAVRDGVTYVNDSKATNPTAAAMGIRAFEEPVHLILGGSLKGGGFGDLRAPVLERCRACYLIGEAEGQLAAALEGTVPLERCGELERAVAAARRAARPGEVILLSPACASYDRYEDFEARGEHFRALAAS